MSQCEYNPEMNREAFTDEIGCPNEATWSVGRGKIHLCDSCKDLPQFRKYRSKIRLSPVEERPDWYLPVVRADVFAD